MKSRKSDEILKTEVLKNSDLVCDDCRWRYENDAEVLGCYLYKTKPYDVLNGGECKKYE